MSLSWPGPSQMLVGFHDSAKKADFSLPLSSQTRSWKARDHCFESSSSQTEQGEENEARQARRPVEGDAFGELRDWSFTLKVPFRPFAFRLTLISPPLLLNRPLRKLKQVLKTSRLERRLLRCFLLLTLKPFSSGFSHLICTITQQSHQFSDSQSLQHLLVWLRSWRQSRMLRSLELFRWLKKDTRTLALTKKRGVKDENLKRGNYGESIDKLEKRNSWGRFKNVL